MVKTCHTKQQLDKILQVMWHTRHKISSLLYSLLGHLTLLFSALYFSSFAPQAKTEQLSVHLVSLAPIGSGSESPSVAENQTSKIIQPQSENSLTQSPANEQKELLPVKTETISPKLAIRKEPATTPIKVKKITSSPGKTSEVDSSASSAVQGKASDSASLTNNSSPHGESGLLGTDGIGVSYNHIVVSHLINAKRYPELARRRGVQGSVILAFEINRDGSVSNGKLSKSCSSDLLNEEALAMVTRASPFPAPPNDYRPGKSLEFQVPIRFSLY